MERVLRKTGFPKHSTGHVGVDSRHGGNTMAEYPDVEMRLPDDARDDDGRFLGMSAWHQKVFANRYTSSWPGTESSPFNRMDGFSVFLANECTESGNDSTAVCSRQRRSGKVMKASVQPMGPGCL